MISVAITTFAFIGNVQAQNRRWSLQECIDHAIRHNIEVKQSRNRIEKLKVEKSTLKNSFLPDLSAGTSQKFDFGRSLNRSNAYEDSNTQSSSFSVSTEMPLFTGFRRSASVSRNKFDLMAAEADKELIENDLSLNVTSCYFQILLNKEIHKIAREQIRLTREQEDRTLLLIENGKAPQSQLYDVKAQLADDELTATEAKSKKTERSNKFVPDPQVKGSTAMNEDYTRSGYDRGHLAPAGDMKWSAKAMRESFYLSNICPQKPKLNRGIWKDLEEQCRLWALDNGSLLIVTGPVITGDMKRLGKNRVAIPKAFYKVLCYHTEKGYKGIGFLFENRDYKDNSLKSMAIPIDSVEKATGIDFFPSIPDDQENEMEAAVDWSRWSF